MTQQLAPQTRRFYDGGSLDEAPDPSVPPVLALERTEEMKPSDFHMIRRIAYLDRQVGELLVPADPATFTTDLASVPSVFAWLVPRTGNDLPAALLHDGLVSLPPEEAPTYISTEGVEVDFEEANRVFRDAMADTGTGLIRRWLMWSATTLAVMLRGDVNWSRAETWRWRTTTTGTFLVLTLLGLWTTADLLDIVGGVPWMGEGPLWVRLVTGAAGAIAIPLVLAQLWGRFRVAGMIAGTTLALLLHVTIAVLILTGLYRAAEQLCARAPRAALALAGVIALAAAVTVVVAL